MNQKTTNGVRVIDAAKAGVEYFMLKRATDPSYAMDRFFLVTFEDGLAAIKVRSLCGFPARPLVLRLHKTANSYFSCLFYPTRRDGRKIRPIF